MGLKKWLSIFLAAALLCAALFAGFNALVDPFGLFGDRLLNWWSYDMTQNPRVAKIGWIDAHHDDYDSYIIGCSKTSSFPTGLLNQYFGGARFYNMTMYGGDLYDTEMTVKYILKNYGAKHIVVNSGLAELICYKGEDDRMKGNLHAKVDGTSLPLFYAKYLFANPDYAMMKLKAYRENTYLVNSNKVFNSVTGAYDKSLRDIEPIGDLAAFLKRYPTFTQQEKAYTSLPAVNACVASLVRVKEMCEAAGATFTFVVSPMYYEDLDAYYNNDLMDFIRKLAAQMDFWDFSGYHSVAYEPRYFYDTTHYRNAVGVMMLARMFGDKNAYVPDDFGVHITKDNVETQLARYKKEPPASLNDDKQVPVLLYHNISDVAQSEYDVTTGTFHAQLTALKNAGYETVSFTDLMNYVEHGTELPEKPLIITFDDGYESNIAIAAPILKEFGMCAEVNVIGSYVGKTTRMDTNEPITPHFSFEEAGPWVKNGTLEIGSHSYDMHQSPTIDTDHHRQGVYQEEGESEKDYIAAFRSDFEASSDAVKKAFGEPVIIYAYPYGYHTDLSEVLLSEMGVRVTLTTKKGINTIVKGLPQSLLSLKRCSVEEGLTPSRLVDFLKGLK